MTGRENDPGAAPLDAGATGSHIITADAAVHTLFVPLRLPLLPPTHQLIFCKRHTGAAISASALAITTAAYASRHTQRTKSSLGLRAPALWIRESPPARGSF